VTGLLRAKSTVTTGGLGNAAIATGELGGSLLTSLLALFMPLVALAFVVVFCWLSVKLIRRLFSRKPGTADPAR
jgi:flagellar biogenesis protein FliO